MVADARHRPRVGRARPLRPGRARRRQPAGRRRRRGGACSTRSRRRRERAAAERPSVADAPLALVARPRRSSDAIDLANASPPSTSSCSRRTRRCSPSGSRPPAASSSAATAPPPSATTSPAPTTCCRPAAPAASPARSAPAPSAAGSRTSRFRAEAAAKLAPHVDALARAEGFPVHGESAMMRSRRMSSARAKQESAAPPRPRSELSLDLDGGESSAATGVGFLDHMLDLLARHGRLGLRVEASGDLETGAHHTVEDVGIVLGQALDEALGDRAGIRRYGSAAGADGRVAGRVRDRHLRAARSASSRPTCRRPRSPASTPSWPRSSSAPSPTTRS